MSEEMSSLPIIALVNSKSGGQDGPRLMRRIRKYLPAESVFDLAEGGPAIGLAQCRDRRTRVLVCGGDGTVAWVLSEIKKMKLPENIRPVVAMLPLGTANDLSRTLKWGPGWAGESIKPVFANMEKASVVFMDQWRVTTSSENPDGQDKVYIMNNYFSVGSDAAIALKFHNQREKNPLRFTNRTRNKGWYAKYAIDTFLRARPIIESVEVELDGNKLPLSKSLSMVLVLNLPSYASGNNPWGKSTKNSKGKNFVRPAIDDGIFEVVGIKGVIHAGSIQTGLASAKRLGQGRNITIRLTKPIAAQVDGEPWLQQPAVITLSHEGTAQLLANSPPTEHPVPAVSLATESPSTPKSTRSSSSSAFTHTRSPILYGPVEKAKRKNNRYYCDNCGLEFFLKYMLDSHCSTCGTKSNTSADATPSSSSPVGTLPSSKSHDAGTSDANGGDDAQIEKAAYIDNVVPLKELVINDINSQHDDPQSDKALCTQDVLVVA